MLMLSHCITELLLHSSSYHLFPSMTIPAMLNSTVKSLEWLDPHGGVNLSELENNAGNLGR